MAPRTSTPLITRTPKPVTVRTPTPMIARTPSPIIVTPKRTFSSQQSEFFENEPKEPKPVVKKEDEIPREDLDKEKKKKKRRRKKKKEEELCEDTGPLTVADLDARQNEKQSPPKEPAQEKKCNDDLSPRNESALEERKNDNHSPQKESAEEEAAEEERYYQPTTLIQVQERPDNGNRPLFPCKPKPVKNFSYSRYRFDSNNRETEELDGKQKKSEKKIETNVQYIDSGIIQVKPIESPNTFLTKEEAIIQVKPKKSPKTLTKDEANTQVKPQKSPKTLTKEEAIIPVKPKVEAIIQVKPKESPKTLAKELSSDDDDALDKRSKARTDERRALTPTPPRNIIHVKSINLTDVSDNEEEEHGRRNIKPASPIGLKNRSVCW